MRLTNFSSADPPGTTLAMITWGHGVCALHPERRGAITCKHCGSYACAECTVDKLWGQTLCAACDARGIASYPIPWDRALSPATFIATCRAVFGDLRLLFPAFPDGSVPRALGFAAVAGALLSAAVALVGLAKGSARFGTSLAFLVTSTFLFVVVFGFAFWACQKLLRGHATLAMCLRACAYLSSLNLITIVTIVTPAILGIVVLAGTLCLHIWAWTLLGVGRGGLTPSRAWTSTLIALVVGTGTTIVIAALVAAIYGAASGELDPSDS